MLAINTAKIYFDHSDVAGALSSYLIMTSVLTATLLRKNKIKMQSASML